LTKEAPARLRLGESLRPLRGLIVGLGSIGRRHLANLKRLEPDLCLAVWHQQRRPKSRAAEASPLVEQVVFQVEDALAFRPDFALVTGPASTHVQTATALALNGVHLFIEKPLSNQLDGVDRLLHLCGDRNLTLLVGYNFRFTEALERLRDAVDQGRIGRILFARAEVGQHLESWRPGKDYRETVSARAELGGGVLLELSHEVDYLRWLVGEVVDVSARVGRTGNLEIDVEDYAEISLRFQSGAIGSIHLDMVQRASTRTCKLVGSEGTLFWDALTDHIQCYSLSQPTWIDLSPYLRELQHFLSCVRGTETPAVTGADSRRVLEIVLAARRSSEEGRVISI
jgi:predicted dehydrogenase